MGSIVSVKQRARKKTTALTAFGPHLFAKEQRQGPRNDQGTRVLYDIDGRSDGLFEERSHARTIGGEVESKVNDTGVADDAKDDSECMRDIADLDEGEGVLNSDKKPKAKQDDFDRDAEVEIVSGSIKENYNANENAARGQDWRNEITDQGNLTNDEAHIYRSLSSTPDSLCQGKPRNVVHESPASDPVSQAFSSWGEGVVGTANRPLSQVGHVTSRGLDVAVKSSAGYYDEYTNARWNKSHSPGNLPIKPHPAGCDCKKCADAGQKEAAAIKIQSHLRGYQARKCVLQKRQSVVKIQKIYRARVKHRLSTGQLRLSPGQSRRRRSRTPSPSPSLGLGAGQYTTESFELYQEDITELKWKSQQLVETTTMGDDYEPQKILLISSNMERPDWLARVSLREVHVILYEFSKVGLTDILTNIRMSLDDYRVGSKAKRIAFVCQGGPGYVYICRGKVLTSKKLQKNRDLQEFLKELGNLISKKDPSDAKVHFIGSNVLGNKRGVTLLQNIQKYMHPARVSVESPYEISESGREMLNEYFSIDLYNIWKKSRYSRMLEITGFNLGTST